MGVVGALRGGGFEGRGEAGIGLLVLSFEA